MFFIRSLSLVACMLALTSLASGQDVITIRIDPSHVLKPVSRYLTGACLEDVNHEVYGGIYSQMIFGESFQEPPSQPVAGFNMFGGEWSVNDGVLEGAAGEGPTLVARSSPTSINAVSVDVYLPGNHAGNAGLIFGVTNAATGADKFTGYEVSLDPSAKMLRLARHQQNYKLIRDVPCDIGTDRWVTLGVELHDRNIDISVDGKSVLKQTFDDVAGGQIGLRTWLRPARFRNLWTAGDQGKNIITLAPDTEGSASGMWRMFHRGDAVGTAALDRTHHFVSSQCQSLDFTNGTGEIGIENRGLNRQGMSVLAKQPYQGHLWARAKTAVKVAVSFASADGSHLYASADLAISDTDWHRYDFVLSPDTTDNDARFEIRLVAPGSIQLGYVFLEPGPWGTFKGLPVRRDVATALIDQGITAMRYGGSMVNTDEYRWKKMIGDRDHRPPYVGVWYRHSSNGWGIFDFLNLCEAAGFLPVPDFNINESPADMVDFLEYTNDPADSPWGAKRVADGHPQPYGLAHIELGNEERVDEVYYKKFEALARAIWAKDPRMILTVGDFSYTKQIADPMNVQGADSRISNLLAHKKILDLAREFNAEVWFDIHIWTEGITNSGSLDSFPSYVDAIDRLANGAKHHVVVFELNAANHQQRRALANAIALIQVEKDGRLPFVSSANCLQVDRQNDNGWDQGLLFLDPAKTWLQPPGYGLQMFSRNYAPSLIDCTVANENNNLKLAANVSDDRRKVVLQAVNTSDAPLTIQVEFVGGNMAGSTAEVQSLTAPLLASNTAKKPERVHPVNRPVANSGETDRYTLAPHSLTFIRWCKAN